MQGGKAIKESSRPRSQLAPCDVACGGLIEHTWSIWLVIRATAAAEKREGKQRPEHPERKHCASWHRGKSHRSKPHSPGSNAAAGACSGEGCATNCPSLHAPRFGMLSMLGLPNGCHSEASEAARDATGRPAPRMGSCATAVAASLQRSKGRSTRRDDGTTSSSRRGTRHISMAREACGGGGGEGGGGGYAHEHPSYAALHLAKRGIW